MIGAKAIGVWLGFTILGLLFADRIAQLLRVSSPLQTLSILSLGLALLLAGVFEHAGLAMIIGAYVMGLTLSKTDLNFTIQKHLEPLQAFFVPIFFTTMGMLVNVHSICTKEALIVGGIYTVGAIFAKMIGSGLPALFLNFNRIGALRIGLGMVPRGEVALIMAGVGLANGILKEDLFSIAVVMTLATTLVAPVLLSRSLSYGGRGTRKEVKTLDTETLTYDFPSEELADLMEHKILLGFQGEGFMLHRLEMEEGICNIQKEHTLILFRRDRKAITIECPQDAKLFIRSLVYEMLVELNTLVATVKDLAKPEDLKRSLADSSAPAGYHFDVTDLLRPECISMNLRGTDKVEIIDELLSVLQENGGIRDLEEARNAVMEREETISTGMQYGLAIPHGRVANVDSLQVAIGISRTGIDFGSLDGKPSHVFVLAIVPSEKKVPYLQFLAAVSAAMSSEESVERFRKLKIRRDVIAFFEN
jgi:mannitol/fructose-specific phosphotransferase system IIA component (Ntr-type)